MTINLYKKLYTIASAMNTLEVWGSLVYVSRFVLLTVRITQVSKCNTPSICGRNGRRLEVGGLGLSISFILTSEVSSSALFLHNSVWIFFPCVCFVFIYTILLFKSNLTDPYFSLFFEAPQNHWLYFSAKSHLEIIAPIILQAKTVGRIS